MSTFEARAGRCPRLRCQVVCVFVYWVRSSRSVTAVQCSRVCARCATSVLWFNSRNVYVERVSCWVSNYKHWL